MVSTKENRLLLAFDGGIDAAVAGMLLKVQGFEPVAVHVRVWDQEGETRDYPRVSYNCAGVQTENQLRSVCKIMQIPLHIIPRTDEFAYEVVENYVSCRMRGRPFFACKSCMSNIILRTLFNQLDYLDAGVVATGHYSRITYNKVEDHYSVYQSRNLEFDSSRLFYGLKQFELARLKFPIGDLDKKEVAILADRFGLSEVVRGRNSSAKEPCFLVDSDSGKLIAGRVPKDLQVSCRGNIVDSENRFLRKHNGIFEFSIGQRPKCKVRGKLNRFVIDINTRKNTVMVGPGEKLASEKVLLGNVNLISIPRLKTREEFLATTMDADFVRCRIEAVRNRKIVLEFFKPENGFFRGQEVALYDRNQLLGGGVIETVLNR